MTTHPYLIRVITADSELVLEDTDFAEDARYDWFDEIVRSSDDGEIVQLINTDDDSVMHEHIVSR